MREEGWSLMGFREISLGDSEGKTSREGNRE